MRWVSKARDCLLREEVLGHHAGWQRPHLCSDQGLKAGLEVVQSAVVEPRHLIQELLVLGLKVIPHGPKLFSGLRSKTLGGTALAGSSSFLSGARGVVEVLCVCVWWWWGESGHLVSWSLGEGGTWPPVPG